MQHRPRKRFGQNFLKDGRIIQRLIQVIAPQPKQNFVEIGPGQGALTFPLLQYVEHLTVIEIDRDLVALLKNHPLAPRLTIIPSDVLEVNFDLFNHSPLRVIGNLPYNISTPILLKLLHYGTLIQDMFFMLQKEVVSRLTAAPGTKQYGRLSVFAQYCCEVYELFEVPPESFTPAPKVMSAIVHLQPKTLSSAQRSLLPSLQHVVKQSFATRRKTLKNNLKGLFSSKDFMEMGIDATLRPEQLTVEEYVALAQKLQQR